MHRSKFSQLQFTKKNKKLLRIDDYFLTCTFYFVNCRFKVDVQQFPAVLKVNEHLKNHPAFQKAHPSNQVDTPSEFKNHTF